MSAGTEPAPTRLSISLEPEKVAWGVLLLLALALRLWHLGDRPFHHDESIHAWFSQHVAMTGDYKYDPVYHGPVQYAAVAIAFRLLGDTDFTARFPAALGGVAFVWMAWLLRPRFGRGPALAAGALLAFSPSLLYFTRFCREDIWSLLGTCGALLFFDRWWREKRLRDLVLAALLLAVAFAAKENFYVFLALLVPSVLCAAWEPGKGLDPWNRLRQLIDVLEEHQVALAAALLLFFVVSELLYTVFLVHPESGNPAFEAISYWYGQHKVERVGGPKTYYVGRLLQYELAILLPAFVWIGVRFRRLSAVERFLAGLGVSSLGMYAYLGEKVPWLMVHQVFAFVPLAALTWNAAAEAKFAWRAAGIALAAGSLVTALSLSFWLPDLTPARDRAESAIYVQTTPEARALVDEVARREKAGARPAVSVAGEANWPYSWYFRHAAVDWSLPTAERQAAIVVVDEDKADDIGRLLGPSYSRQTMPLRAWWVPDSGWKPLQPSPTELLRYVFTRKPWAPGVGAQNVIVFRREESRGGDGRP